MTLSLNNLPGYFQVVVVSLFSKGVTMVGPALMETSTMVVSRPAPTVAVVPVCVDMGNFIAQQLFCEMHLRAEVDSKA